MDLRVWKGVNGEVWTGPFGWSLNKGANRLLEAMRSATNVRQPSEAVMKPIASLQARKPPLSAQTFVAVA